LPSPRTNFSFAASSRMSCRRESRPPCDGCDGCLVATDFLVRQEDSAIRPLAVPLEPGLLSGIPAFEHRRAPGRSASRTPLSVESLVSDEHLTDAGIGNARLHFLNGTRATARPPQTDQGRPPRGRLNAGSRAGPLCALASDPPENRSEHFGRNRVSGSSGHRE